MAEAQSGSVSDFKDTVAMYHGQSALVDRIWFYFNGVTLAVLGFAFGSDWTLIQTIVVVVFYAAFCSGSGLSEPPREIWMPLRT